MNIGMLWFDNDNKATLSAKITRAAAYYQKKYGQRPNLCFVHPSMLVEGQMRSENVEVLPTKAVLPNHFWIGIKSENGQLESSAA